MDAAGAGELRKRLEQQEHWRQADAVRDGRQLPSDPDVQELLTRNRDVHSALDARLQARAASVLAKHIEEGRFTRGAAS